MGFDYAGFDVSAQGQRTALTLFCISVLWPSGAVTPTTVLVDGGGGV